MVKPEYEIAGIDSYDIRPKILNISYVGWKKFEEELGINDEKIECRNPDGSRYFLILPF